MPDRNDPSYFERMLTAHFARSQSSVIGVSVGFPPPESFEELMTVVANARNPDCGISEEVDGMVELISVLPDRDEVVRRLPYNHVSGALAFILPELS